MSHIVTIRTEVRDAQAVAAACRRLQLPEPVHGTATLFAGRATGLLVRLPGWTYPVVAHLDDGRLEFDDFGGAWGDRRHLDAFLQAYAVERTIQQARRHGHRVAERSLPDGSIRLTLSVGGGA